MSEQLAPKHYLVNFDSGQEELDTWLKEFALKASERDYGRTYIWHKGDNLTVAFYTLSAHLISAAELPPKRARGQQNVIPAILLGKMALDLSLQGHGLGEVLLADAIARAVSAADIAAAKYLIVDPLSAEVLTFCEKYGFVRGLNAKGENPRLFARLKDFKFSLD